MTIVEDRPVVAVHPPAAPPAGTSDTSRWRLSARLARREVRRRPWRTLLVVLLIGVPVAGLVLGDIAYRTDRAASDPAREFGAASTGGWMYGEASQVDLPALVERVAPGLVAAGRLVTWQEATLPLRIAGQPDRIAWITVRTVDLHRSLTVGLTPLRRGRLPAAADEVLVDSRAARELGVAVGDVFTLVHPAQTFTVVGVGDGDDGVMVAPGFDVDAVQPGTLVARLLLDDEATRVIAGQVWPTAVSLSLSSPTLGDSNDAVELLFGWLVGVMLMAVLGIVVAAAFAVSGRRQLVCIGQLSASGADPAIIRRYLALQGTFAGTVAAIGGTVGGIVAAYALGDIVVGDGRPVIDLSDIVVVVLTAVVVATVAAIVPSRSLVRSSVLSALGGRRPVAPVRRRQVPIGVALLGAGSVGLWVAVDAASNGSSAEVPGMLLGTMSGLATLAGVCCVCPVVVDVTARVGSRRGGSVRLATRSLGRHRARSAALLAAIVAVTAAGVAVASVVDRELVSQRDSRMSPNGSLRTVETYSSVSEAGSGVVEPGSRPVATTAALRASVEQIVGPVQWVATSTALPAGLPPDSVGLVPIVVEPGVLEALGLDERERAEVARHDAVLLDPFNDIEVFSTVLDTVLPGVDVAVVRPTRDGGQQRLLVTRVAADEHALVFGHGSTFALLDHDLTRSEYDALQELSVASSDAAYFRGIADDQPSVGFGIAMPTEDWTMVARIVIMAALLLLVFAVVTIGMALWAAEGRDERNALVALGAPPAVLARTAALRAWFLATVGAVLGVPFGWWIIRVATSAVDASTPFPWLIAGGVLVAIPALVAAATWLGSGLGQRIRRGRGAVPAVD